MYTWCYEAAARSCSEVHQRGSLARHRGPLPVAMSCCNGLRPWDILRSNSPPPVAMPEDTRGSFKCPASWLNIYLAEECDLWTWTRRDEICNALRCSLHFGHTSHETLDPCLRECCSLQVGQVIPQNDGTCATLPNDLKRLLLRWLSSP